ncbi:MAG: hypothetical protein RR721_03785 [Aeromonas sp.]|uniref:hypothetical protein n=1 Tax=Aeromonas sp. TaxID=647 RepID=UPI002FC62336
MDTFIHWRNLALRLLGEEIEKYAHSLLALYQWGKPADPVAGEVLAVNAILLLGNRQGDIRQHLGSMQSLNILSLVEALARYAQTLPTRL